MFPIAAHMPWQPTGPGRAALSGTISGVRTLTRRARCHRDDPQLR